MPPATPLSSLPARPLISVVVPSYNQGAFIRQTIESCLTQDYHPIEVIVMDGASPDNTVEVLTSLGNLPELQWTSEPDDGVVDAVNKGMRQARGDICAIQSSDDFYLPGAFSHAAATFARHPDMALIYADTIKVDAQGKELSRWVSDPFSIENFLTKQTVILQPAAFFRREAFWEAGGWSPDYFNADTECWLRMIMRRPALKVDAVWASRRMHEGQRDQQNQRIIESFARMMRENPDIRRGPVRWRRASRCGVLLHTIRYSPAMSLRRKKWLLLQAALAWPAIWRPMDLAGQLIPGWRRLRRRLFKPPSTSAGDEA
ncbi:MAG: glycosyltransferase [Lentisphaerae bacterium]|jgi:glycosyltransferase involved in cell wall biosynthesis|nr:glycosyltransferase [Lentisphaerota bacterium]NLL02663.1 glycosyltransferase [Mollicutes bacterium]